MQEAAEVVGVTGILHTTADWLALQWFADRVIRRPSNPDSGSTCQVVDLTDRPAVACPTCGHEREAVSA